MTKLFMCKAIELRFGAPLCHPHQYCHCVTEVECLATHWLSCHWSEVIIPVIWLSMILIIIYWCLLKFPLGWSVLANVDQTV